MTNARIRKKLAFDNEEVILRSPVCVFADFFREMQGRELSEEERKVVETVAETAGGR